MIHSSQILWHVQGLVWVILGTENDLTFVLLKVAIPFALRASWASSTANRTRSSRARLAAARPQCHPGSEHPTRRLSRRNVCPYLLWVFCTNHHYFSLLTGLESHEGAPGIRQYQAPNAGALPRFGHHNRKADLAMDGEGLSLSLINVPDEKTVILTRIMKFSTNPSCCFNEGWAAILKLVFNNPKNFKSNTAFSVGSLYLLG